MEFSRRHMRPGRSFIQSVAGRTPSAARIAQLAAERAPVSPADAQASPKVGCAAFSGTMISISSMAKE